jgi:hypothetical protein
LQSINLRAPGKESDRACAIALANMTGRIAWAVFASIALQGLPPGAQAGMRLTTIESQLETVTMA